MLPPAIHRLGTRLLHSSLPLLFVVGWVLPACGQSSPVEFNRDVRPILVRHCLACHGGVKQAGGLSFVSAELAFAEGDSGVPVIQRGDADASLLIERVIDPDDDTRMPPPEHGRRLSADEVATLRRWIDQSAEWQKPWAFTPPQSPTVPAVANSGWLRQPLDAFVLRRLEAEGLRPADEADRAQWLRRVTFDLIGLPPTEAERITFENDPSDDAHRRVVDRLLASPHFGERWASVWLDLARYADTMGYERDFNRTIWPWRDWVVRAFNEDLPYNEFLLKQTAGDLLPGASIDDRLATAFHRNSPTNVEGGTDDEEYRWNAVVDRVDSTWAGVLGMTMGCARCHDHPYDPLTHEDYHRFAALLNTTQDADLVEEWPKLAVPKNPQQHAEAGRIDRELVTVRQRLQRLGAQTVNEADWQPLAIAGAKSTGETRLRVVDAPQVENQEVIAEGTVTDQSIYTIQATTTAGRATALRVEVLPKDPAKAAAVPEMGFILSNLRLEVERAKGEPEDAVWPMFSHVLADEADGFFDADDSIRDNSEGWGAYTRMRHPRWAAFVLDQPLELHPGDRLTITLKHGKKTDGQGPLVIQRLRLATTSDDTPHELVTGKAYRAQRQREEELVTARKAIPATPVPVLVEQERSLGRVTHRFDRGSWLSPAEAVSAALPEGLAGSTGDRLELGRWLGSPENPLTARVFVNRVWATLFNRGLVETLDDFGSTGTKPSHPELLDHLAVRFRDNHAWSLKSLLREIALSATYRQDARVPDPLVSVDPTNRLLARGPRSRLTAEMIRDQALVLSGRFNPKLGGRPVMPYQPDGVWQTVHNGARWQEAKGENRYRRALYTFWKRTAGYPSLIAFDVPSREQCTARRGTTNTPLQALVTLNDPAFVELAEGLAERMLARDESIDQRIGWAMQEATTQPPGEHAVRELVSLYNELQAEESIDQQLAMTLVANAILNLDAALTK